MIRAATRSYSEPAFIIISESIWLLVFKISGFSGVHLPFLTNVFGTQCHQFIYVTSNGCEVEIAVTH